MFVVQYLLKGKKSSCLQPLIDHIHTHVLKCHVVRKGKSVRRLLWNYSMDEDMIMKYYKEKDSGRIVTRETNNCVIGIHFSAPL